MRLTRAVRLARISRWLVSVVTTDSSVSVGLGTSVVVAAAVWSCGRCALDQSRATRSNRAGLYLVASPRNFVSLRWGNGTSVVVGEAVELRSLYAWPEPCDSLESPILRLLLSQRASSVSVDNGIPVVVGEAVGVAVAVRLTRAVRLARISRWLRLSAVPEIRQFRWGNRNFGRGCRSGRGCGRCALGQSRATRSDIALACFRCRPQISSVSVGLGTSVVVGEAVGVAVAVRLTRAVRLARISAFYACCCPRNFVSLGGQWNFGRGWRSGGSCGRCTLDQSRATRSNIALACFRCNHNIGSCGGARNFRGRLAKRWELRSLCA